MTSVLFKPFAGSITLQALYDTYGQFIESYPKVQKDKLLKQYERTWKVLFNCGQEVPPDYQLTEEQFLKNMWVSVNKPNFIDEVGYLSSRRCMHTILYYLWSLVLLTYLSRLN